MSREVRAARAGRALALEAVHQDDMGTRQGDGLTETVALRGAVSEGEGT